MNRRHIFTIGVLLGSVALGWEIGGANRFGNNSFEAEEAARLRRHFTEVEREMLSRDISDLSPGQRAARADQIRLLRQYSEQGSFPRNAYHPGTRTPYFRDARGNLCAMAFLLAASGRGDIVDHIARTRNYEFVPDLVDVPGLAEWLVDHGLTLAEAARIQPSYDGGTCCDVITPPPGPGTGYLVASAGLGGLAGLSIAMNARAPERLSRGTMSGALGLGIGGVTLAMGAFKVGKEGWKNQTLGAWNIAVGAAAAMLGGRALIKRREHPASPAARLRIVPTARAGSRPAFGLQGHFRF